MGAMIMRYFSLADDELILAQSRGEMPVNALRQKLRIGTVALQRRADELHVRLYVPRGTPKRGPSLPVDNLEPAKINDDKLLARLQEQFPDRRYGYGEYEE
jgi:hypothetical protein